MDEDDLDDLLMKLVLRVLDLAKIMERSLIDDRHMSVEQKNGLLVNTFIRAAAVIAHTTRVEEEAFIDCSSHHYSHWEKTIAMWDGDFSMKQ